MKAKERCCICSDKMLGKLMEEQRKVDNRSVFTKQLWNTYAYIDRRRSRGHKVTRDTQSYDTYCICVLRKLDTEQQRGHRKYEGEETTQNSAFDGSKWPNERKQFIKMYYVTFAE